MNKVLKRIKDLGLSAEDKLMRKYGMYDEELNLTEACRLALCELEAKEQGYKSAEAMAEKLGCDNELSGFEVDSLYKKHLPTLLEQIAKLEKEEKKK